MFALVAGRRAALLEAEAIVYRGDRTALLKAASSAADPNADFDDRRHCCRVLRIAIERELSLERVDTATRYGILEEWRKRRGSLIA